MVSLRRRRFQRSVRRCSGVCRGRSAPGVRAGPQFAVGLPGGQRPVHQATSARGQRRFRSVWGQPRSCRSGEAIDRVGGETFGEGDGAFEIGESTPGVGVDFVQESVAHARGEIEARERGEDLG